MRTLADFDSAIDSLLAKASVVYGMAEIEPELAALLDFMEQRTELRQSLAERLIALMRKSPIYPRLGQAGIVELLEYTMHKLRWVEIEHELNSINMEASDLSERRSARRVLGAFRDDWADGDIYAAYRTE